MADITVTAASVRPLDGATIRRFTAGGAGSVGDLVYIASDDDVEQTDASSAGTSGAIGVVVSINGQPGSTTFAANDRLDVVIDGPVTGFTAMTPGALHYVSNTAGALADAAGDNSYVVGRAESATTLLVAPYRTDTIGSAAVTAVKLSATLKTGFIPLSLTSAREIASNDIPATAADAGILSSDTTPILGRVNGATDKALRLTWAATNADEIQFSSIPKPPDLDEASVLTVHLMLAKNTNTDTTAVVAVSIWDGVGDTNAGGNTAALAAATLAEYTVTLAAANLAGPPGFLNIGITPGTHANDAIYLYAAWLEYTRA